MPEEELSEEVVRRMIRLVGDVAGSNGGLEARRKQLMAGLAELTGADAWAWAIVPTLEQERQACFASFTHGGFDDKRLGKLLLALEHPDFQKLSQRLVDDVIGTGRQQTRTMDQVDPDGFFEVCDAKPLWDAAGVREVLVSMRPLENGLTSGIAMYRRDGAKPFSPRESKIAHIVLTEVPWLHEAGWSDGTAAEVPRLSPRRRTVLNLVLEGMSRKTMASQLGISEHTLGGYVKDIFRHFDVHSQAELIARFRKGDGYDTPDSGG